MNELFCICILIICMLSVYLANKYLDKRGLTIVFIVSNVLSFILTFKYIAISTLTFNANAITYVTMFTSLYLLLENNDKRQVTKIIDLNFIINIFSASMLYIMSLYTQSLTDTIGINMTNVFINNSRLLIVYPLTLIISQKLLIRIYDKIKNLYDNLFISTVTTYLAIGLIESILYVFLSYYNLLNTQIIIKLLLSTYMLRLIITVIYSLFLTLINNKKKVKK